ncbi:hypothetical protein [Streptomyces sp. CBMA29]|uniref:hypothetical protein n=1 Tax=Streptomyces sp. CBMA29 TaxID=1896314 RepID=UPI001661D65D|nr:hypothetical protein [Streptomyces sp. CBMA29]MBD0734254.1 hypothetical protein [Streptomyces sp. CBMA29]
MTTPHEGPGGHTVIGVAAGSVNLREADHLIRHLADVLDLPAATVACTHLVRSTARPRTAVSFALPDAEAATAAWDRLLARLSPEDTAGPGGAGPGDAGLDGAGAALGADAHGPAEEAHSATAAAAEHTRRSGGRAVLYPGAEGLTGTVTVADLLARTAIDQVVLVGAPPATDGGGPDPHIAVRTRDHVRPQWRDGRLVLALTPAPGGTLAPFEVPNPTPCCADHP